MSGRRLVDAQFFDGVEFKINIHSMKAVANGGSAQILVGNVEDDDHHFAVAVKVFRTVLNDAEKMLLARELEIARQVSVRHPLILAFIGTADIGPEPSIVSLYMKNGNLLEYIKANQDVDRKKLIIDVAEAVLYLHTVEGLVHGDLKCGNVLISDFGDALLADFGLSTYIEKAQSNDTTATDARAKHTLRFAAPELFLDSAGYPPRRRSKTRESDVYAFGMLILEALTEKPPWFGFNEFGVMHRVVSGNVPCQPENDKILVSISHAWWDICESCWSYDPIKRPDMKTVLDGLRLCSIFSSRKIEAPYQTFIVSSACMPCGHRLALLTKKYGGGFTVWIYDMASGQLVVQPLDISEGYYDLHLLAVITDGSRIAAAGGYSVQWDVDAGTLHGKPATCEGDRTLAFSPDTKSIATISYVSNDRTIRLRDASTGRRIDSGLMVHESSVRCAAFSPDGRHIASAAGVEFLLWNVESEMQIAARTDAGGVSCACFLPDGERIVTGSQDGGLRMWCARTLQLERTLHRDTPEYTSHHHIRSVAVSPSGKHIAYSSGRTISIWDVETGERVGSPRSHFAWVDSVGFSRNGRRLVFRDHSTVRIWDLRL